MVAEGGVTTAFVPFMNGARRGDDDEGVA